MRSKSWNHLAAQFSMALGALTIGASVHALPESRMGTHAGSTIPNFLIAHPGDIEAARAEFAKTSIPELDALWASAETVTLGKCSRTENNCLVLSVFKGAVSNRPIVLLPGFTGYRKMYIEQIYDLLQAGYGPVLISDFTGTGDSYKPELTQESYDDKAKMRVNPTVDEVLSTSGGSSYLSPLRVGDAKVLNLYQDHIIDIVGKPHWSAVASLISQQPIGRGYINDYNDYERDINFIMNEAIKRNPKDKIVLSSLSASGLTVMLALNHQDQLLRAGQPAWLSHVDRIILESPMLRTRASRSILNSGIITDAGAVVADIIMRLKFATPEKGFPEFADKALGNFNPKNNISHSINRITLTDSMRVWNGHETAGTTFAYGATQIKYQYVMELGDFLFGFSDPLNWKAGAIADALKRTGVTLITVHSKVDALVDPDATWGMLKDIKKSGMDDVYYCTFETSRHVIDQESDKYRDPYLALLIDMKERRNQRSQAPHANYGTAPQNEVMHCVTPKRT